MMKTGPCDHCGVEHTPLWSNIPPSKPVLCNTCGSRWRARGNLDDYVPKYITQQATDVGHYNGKTNYSASASRSASAKEPNTKGLVEPLFENIPKRTRSPRDPFILTPMERLSKQLYNIAHTQPEVFSKEPVVEDVLIDQTHKMMFTPPETLLGAMLLGSSFKEFEKPEPTSSFNVKTSDASPVAENGGNLSPK